MVFVYRRFKPRNIRKPPRKGTTRVQIQRLVWVFQTKGNMSRDCPMRGTNCAPVTSASTRQQMSWVRQAQMSRKGLLRKAYSHLFRRNSQIMNATIATLRAMTKG